MTTQNKPHLIYDGTCGFCTSFIERWKGTTGDRVEYVPSQECGGKFPQISNEKFDESVQLVEVDGSVYQGAEAVFRTLAHGPRRFSNLPLRMYQLVPGVSFLSECGYHFVAQRRPMFNKLYSEFTQWEMNRSEYVLTRNLFLTLLGLVYLTAFLSLAVQVEGLFGSQGIIPIKETLSKLEVRSGDGFWWKHPTLFWLNSEDSFLKEVCYAGSFLSFLVVLGVGRAPLLFVLWFLYLSLIQVGGKFLGYQWDTLLLEMGFLSVFFAPFRFRKATQPPPSKTIVFLLRLLLFKLIFFSGWVKVFGGDPNWKELRALNFHYETQPLPTWLGWYAHHLPHSILQFSVFLVFVIQLAIPFLIFGTRRPRIFAFFALAFLQILILLTGNYGFFNWMTLVLCLILLDDKFLRPLIQLKFLKRLPFFSMAAVEEENKRALVSEPEFKKAVIAFLFVIFVAFNFFMKVIPLLDRTYKPPQVMSHLYEYIRPYYIINGYGLFAWMTTTRPEISIEGSMDGKVWKEYEFKWKPGDLKKAPAFIAPYHPRLDWQMWFAALGAYQRNPWLISMMLQLIKGSEPVLELLGSNPFPEKAPRYMRAMIYDYRFTDWETKEKDGTWWRKELKGMYTPVLELPIPNKTEE